MKSMSALSFVIDAINRHYHAYGRKPLRIELSPANCDAVFDDPAVRPFVNLESLVTTIHGIDVVVVANIAPRLIRFDGATEEM